MVSQNKFLRYPKDEKSNLHNTVELRAYSIQASMEETSSSQQKEREKLPGIQQNIPMAWREFIIAHTPLKKIK